MLKANTKLMRGALEQYMNPNRWTYTDIYEAYGKPSVYKVRAWEHCKDLAVKYNGSMPLILGKNCMQFSVGFIGEYEGKKAFFFITRDYDRYMPL